MPEKLSAQVLQDMLDDDYRKTHKQFESYFSEQETVGSTYQDMSNVAHNALFDKLSEPMKTMQREYLNKVSSTCYKDKHMADDVPNEQ